VIGRVAKFAGASGAGLCLDYAVYTVLCEAGLPAGWANLISAGIAVTFVYVVSLRHIFGAPDLPAHRLFVLYAAYQVVAVSAASYAVDLGTELLDGRYLLGKTLVLPFSFTANFLFMSWLLSERGRRPTVREQT
jgi:putative flippase GtrA